MFKKFISWMLPIPKTMLESAVSKILKQQIVRNHGLTATNPSSGSMFMVGTSKFRGGSLRFEFFTVLFSHEDGDVMIKRDNEIIFFFSLPEEVEEIRNAITTSFNRMEENKKKKTKDEFARI